VHLLLFYWQEYPKSEIPFPKEEQKLNMVNDTARLVNDIQVIVGTLCPDIDENRLMLRLEEVMSNYEIHRKSFLEVAEDIPEKVSLFLSSRRLEGFSSQTLKDYEIELGLFDEFMNKAAVQVTTSDIRLYLASNTDVILSTTGKKLSVLKSFFGWLVQEEILLRDPTAKIKLPKTPKRLPKGLSIEELEMVRESCQTLRQRAMLEVFYSTACRLSELAGLNIEDIDMQAMNARVIGKGDKERVVYLSFKALYHLKKYLAERNDDCAALFVTERKPHRRMGNAAIQREINKIGKESKVSTKLTPHVLRHTFGNLSMNAGIELADLQHLLGHSSPSTTLTYANVSEERKQQAFKKFHVQ